MESTFPFGGRCEVGFTAIIKQARTRGKYWIKREACALQSDSSKKGEIEVGAPSRPKVGDIQSLYRRRSSTHTFWVRE
jgi:hypothetical protein